MDNQKGYSVDLREQHYEEGRELLIGKKPFFTYVFLSLQIVMFILLESVVGNSNTSNLINFGAKFNPLILEGEWWRFFTPIFLHIGFFHLATNTIVLFFIGTIVERIFGKGRFLFIYLFAGFGGTLASFVFSPNIAAGASGAIFGCFGALLYFGMIYPKLFLRTVGLNVFVVVIINLAFGFTVPGIDNAGHIGGLIGGFFAAGIVHFPRIKRRIHQGAFLVVTLLISTGLLQFGHSHPEVVLDETSITIMAQQYMEDKDYKGAYNYLNELDMTDVHSSQYYFLLSFVEIKLAKYDEAKESLLQAIELEPNFHEAHFNLALVYLEEQNWVRAKNHVAMAAEIKPEEEQYIDLLGQFH